MADERHEDMLQVVVGGEKLLIRSAQISEVARPAMLTPVPMGPDHIMGLANIHGQIVCIVDISKMAGWSRDSAPNLENGRFVVLRHASKHVGVQVDQIGKIHRVAGSDLDALEASDALLSQLTIDQDTYHMLDCSALLH